MVWARSLLLLLLLPMPIPPPPLARASSPRRPSSDPPVVLVWLLAELPKGRGAMPPPPPKPSVVPSRVPPWEKLLPMLLPLPLPPLPPKFWPDEKAPSTSWDEPRSSVGGGGGGRPPLDDSVLMILRWPPVEAMRELELEYPPERYASDDSCDDGETSKMASGEAARLSAEE